MNIELPDDSQRWRCAGCGNLTRFDITRTFRTTEFWHFDLAGEHDVESTEIRAQSLEAVSCRWCGRDDAIEVISRNAASSLDDPTTASSD